MHEPLVDLGTGGHYQKEESERKAESGRLSGKKQTISHRRLHGEIGSNAILFIFM